MKESKKYTKRFSISHLANNQFKSLIFKYSNHFQDVLLTENDVMYYGVHSKPKFYTTL